MINLTTDIQQITAALTYKIDGINKELNYLEQLNQQTFLIVEYGIESANNTTLPPSTAAPRPAARV